ncbi:esterase FrsA [Motilimonas cestriensis]|uniref:Esterase FrsA n=1 Tax=Motilimonas cestriensis TaxID=2742685 RepID=A0ABS8W674_9GAMM|nr:esterase FrsA [Motilimonas cestriensis]MCE2593592.1 esterase FrsA [Motilimonas cestriensis]
MSSQNLSEKLFKIKFNYPETSTISNPKAKLSSTSPVGEMMDNDNTPGWYRLLRRAQWAWQGIDPIEVEAILAKIAMSKQTRTRDDLLDTVTDYRKGNWTYEWSQPGAVWQHKAKDALANEQFDLARHAFYMASQYYAVSGYPHLKGDELALQAHTLANLCYREMGKLLPNPLRIIDVPYKGKTIHCYLHLAQEDQISPVVIVCGAIDTMQIEYFKLFERNLAPAGLAMLTVDMPGLGFASSVKLEQDSTQVLQAVIAHLKKVPWVDYDNIALLGGRLGANLVTRLAYIEPFSIKAAVSVGGAVDKLFVEPERFNLLPQMMLDTIANRMGLTSEDHELLFQRCKVFSLSRQGLLGRSRTKVPLLSIGHAEDLICPEIDIKMIARGSLSGESIIINQPPIFKSYYRALDQAAEWLKQYLLDR